MRGKDIRESLTCERKKDILEGLHTRETEYDPLVGGLNISECPQRMTLRSRRNFGA